MSDPYRGYKPPVPTPGPVQTPWQGFLAFLRGFTQGPTTSTGAR